MTNSRRTQAERAALSDQQMFDAAVELIVERGPEKSTLSEIGIRAGYSRGLATYRYKTKDVFYAALIDYLHLRWCEVMDASVDGLEGEAAVLATVSALQQFVRSQPRELRALFKLYYYSIDHESEMTRKLDEIHRSQRRQAAGWAAQAGAAEPDQFAQQYCALVFGAIYQWLVNPAQVPLTPLLEACKSSLLSVLKQRIVGLSYEVK